MYLFFSVSLAFLLRRARGTDLSSGSSKCPCISTYPIVERLRQMQRDLNCTNDEFPVYPTAVTGTRGKCIKNYGIGCGNHDSPDGVLCSGPDVMVPDGDDFNSLYLHKKKCYSKWCYVDFTNCTLESAPSVMLPEQQEALRFSFTTCGSRATPDPEIYMAMLAGSTIRVTYLENELYSFKNEVGEWHGILPSLVNAMATKMNFTVEVVDISAEAFEVFPSPVLACAYDTTTGHSDVCFDLVGTPPDLAARFTFLDAYDALPFGLLVRDFKTTDSWFGFFNPLVWQVWFVLFVSFCVIGVVLLYVEGGDIVSSTTNRMEWSELGFETNTWQRKVILCCDSVYLSYLFFVGHQLINPRSCGGKIVNLSLLFLVLVMAGYYTGNLVALLVVKNEVFGINSIEDIMEQDKVLCTVRPIAVELKSRFGIEDRNVLVPIEIQSSLDISSLLKNNGCDAWVFPYTDLVGAIAKDCVNNDFKIVSKSVMFPAVTSVVAPRWKNALDYALMQTRRVFDYPKSKEAFYSQRLIGVPDECMPGYVADGESEPLSLTDLAGIFICLLIAMVLAIMIKCSKLDKRITHISNPTADATKKLVRTLSLNSKSRIKSGSDKKPTRDEEVLSRVL